MREFYAFICAECSRLIHSRGLTVLVLAPAAMMFYLQMRINGHSPTPWAVDGGAVSGVLMFAAALAALFYGRDTFREREYYRFLVTLTSSRSVFAHMVLARLAVIGLAVGVMAPLFVAQLSINGAPLTLSEIMNIPIFLSAAYLALAFFFLLGVLVGMMKAKHFQGIFILVLWMVFAFVVPSLMGILAQSGMPMDRDMSAETKHRAVQRFNSVYDSLSTLTPPSFFLRIAGDVSGDGPGEETGRRTVFRRRSHIFKADTLPGEFAWGMISNVIMLMVMYGVGWERFSLYLYAPVSDRRLNENNKPVILSSGECRVLRTEPEKHLGDTLFRQLSGRSGYYGFNVKLEIDGTNLTFNSEPRSFIYLCHPRNIPEDFTPFPFMLFMARLLGLRGDERDLFLWEATDKDIRRFPFAFAELEPRRLGVLYMALPDRLRADIYLLDDVDRGMPFEWKTALNHCMEQWTGETRTVLYLTSDPEVCPQQFKQPETGCDYLEDAYWMQQVSRIQELTGKSSA